MAQQKITQGERCTSRVSPSGPWGFLHPYQCKRKGTVTRNGKLYCTIHDPQYIETKRKERHERWKRVNDGRGGVP